MQIIFDRGLDTQRAITIDAFGENISRGILSASMSRTLCSGDVGVPYLGALKAGFATVDIVDGRIAVPVQGTYNAVVDAAAAYDSSTKEYSITVILGKTES